MRLRSRIMGVQSNHGQAMAGQHPAGTSATPMVMPLHQLTYLPSEGYPWGTAVYEDMVPMWAPDGAMIPSTHPAGHARVVPAGRASPAHR